MDIAIFFLVDQKTKITLVVTEDLLTKRTVDHWPRQTVMTLLEYTQRYLAGFDYLLSVRSS